MTLKFHTRNIVPLYHYIYIFSGLFVSVLSNPPTSPPNLAKATTTNAMVSLGSVEGKTYYAEMTRQGAWTQSRAICLAAGMHLASITTSAQSEFIFSSEASEISSPYYWTGGRDARNITQFEWDHDSETPLDGILPFVWRAGMKTCLVLLTAKGTYIQYLTYGCDDEVAAYTLCEKIDAVPV